MNPQQDSSHAWLHAAWRRVGRSAGAQFATSVGMLCSVLFLALAHRSYAGSATASFQATASVVKACTISTPATLGFGVYDPGSSTPLVATTNFNVMCTSGTSYSIGLSQGTGAGSTVTNRLMTSSSAAAGSNTLQYGLFQDAAHTVSWDNSASASGFSGTGTSQPITIYGQVPSRQYTAAPATDYSDVVTMTLSY